MAQSIAVAYLGKGSDDTRQSDRLYLADQRIVPGPHRSLERSVVYQDPIQIYAVADDGDALGHAAETVLAVLDRHRLATQLEGGSFDEDWIYRFIQDCEQALARLLEPRRGAASGVSLALCLFQHDTAAVVTIGSACAFLCRDRQMIPLPEHRQEPISNRLGLMRERTMPGSRDHIRVSLQTGDLLVLLSDGALKALEPAQLNSLVLQPGPFIHTMRRLRDTLLEPLKKGDGFALVSIRITDPADQEMPAKAKNRRTHLHKKDMRRYEALQHPFSRREAELRHGLTAHRWLVPLIFGALLVLIGLLLLSLIWPGFLPGLPGR